MSKNVLCLFLAMISFSASSTAGGVLQASKSAEWQAKYFASHRDISAENKDLLKTGKSIPVGITWNEWIEWHNHYPSVMHHRTITTDKNVYASGSEVQLILGSWCDPKLQEMGGMRQTYLYFNGTAGNARLTSWQEMGC